MKDIDFDRFAESWIAAHEVTGKEPTDAGLAMAYKILEKYDISDIQSAIMFHLSDPESGQFAPKPADIIKQIEENNPDGRPAPDEAWSIALQSFDEYATVVLNDEIAASLEYAREIYHQGDKTGARMAFKQSYEKQIKAARSEGKPVKWWPSLGMDAAGRQSVIEKAVFDGLLTAESVAGLLPEPITVEGQKLMTETFKQITND